MTHVLRHKSEPGGRCVLKFSFLLCLAPSKCSAIRSNFGIGNSRCRCIGQATTFSFTIAMSPQFQGARDKCEAQEENLEVFDLSARQDRKSS
mmetsp:Transcript_24430/g.39947  ORF Transcript_24430/g.39947 Transcript_24430/m.39947 type:complete len:92 (+) Transcript_24430:350-625(+)